MDPKFEIGEVAILKESVCWPEYNGQECTITGDLELRSVYIDRARTIRGDIRPRYVVRCQDGHIFAVPPSCLRKRRPPQDWIKLCHLSEVPIAPVNYEIDHRVEFS
jgi:hypothetical protein